VNDRQDELDSSDTDSAFQGRKLAPVRPLDDLFARPGLEPAIRAVACAQVAAARGDWATLTAVVEKARALGCDRDLLAEGLLQGVLFYRFPRSITAFQTLAEAWPAATPPHGGSLPVAAQAQAGRDLFAAIYRKNAAAVAAMLASCHGELHDFVLDVAYGRILSRPLLPPRARELAAVAVLAALEQIPQLVAHGRGALHFGADLAALREALFIALAPDADAVERLLQKIARTA
jgi:alkylhydroperoxidase/carboxymuconolactone decarboxylase family protein YurZ